MYRGRFQLGEEITLGVLCLDGNNTPQIPTAAPIMQLWGPSGLALTKTLPVLDRYQVTGLFQKRVFLDGNFAAGAWKAVYTYTLGSGYVGQVEDTFEIAAGGNADGAAIAMYFFDRPQAAFLVRQLDSGKIKKGRNPGV